jgi:hypothetical protein
MSLMMIFEHGEYVSVFWVLEFSCLRILKSEVAL